MNNNKTYGIAMRNALILATLTILAFFLSANQKQHTPDRKPTILIKNIGDTASTPLKLSSLKVDVEIIGNLVTTTMEMTYYNPHNRVLEGDFYFPLGEGQTVSRFALEVNGKYREGVVVEKDKGRQVFEEVVRQKIDPGLLEWTKGNNFKSRIYPIPAVGYKKVLIAYEQELIDNGEGLLYNLPLNYQNTIDTFALNIVAYQQQIPPQIKENANLNIKFNQAQATFLASITELNFEARSQFSFILPKENDYQRVFVEEKNENESYFYINLSPEITKKAKVLPRKIALLWDASSSAKDKDIETELKLLDSYFRKIGNLQVELVIFSNDIHKTSSYNISGGNWDKLKQELLAVQYDGGTQLGAIDLSKYQCDEYIISSDGLSNFGDSEIKLSKSPIITINSCQQANHSYLKYIAQSTAGEYINLNNLNLEQAQEILASNPYSFINAVYDKNIISETYPSAKTKVTADFSIAGIMKGEKAEITLNFGYANDIKFSKKIIIEKKNKIQSSLIKRIWAQKKIAELDVMYDKNEEEITRLGKEFSIVTRNTSLIVLDRLEDYLRHKIVPPDELKEQYFAKLKEAKTRETKDEMEHLEMVVKMFNNRIEWWNKTFPKDKPKFIKQRERPMSQDADGIGAGEARPSRQARTEQITGAANRSQEQNYYSLALMPKSEEQTPVDVRKESVITLKKWDPQTPYLNELKSTRENEIYDKYLKLKEDYANSSAFYLDVADFFNEKGKKELALRILSNIAEMELENPQLLRILGHRLNQLGYYKLAAFIFAEVLKMRPEDPQSYRDLGLTYASDQQYQKAIDLLWKVVNKDWHQRFPEIELIALNEMNAIIATCGQVLDLSNIDNRLIKNLPVDIRVVLEWDADNCDIDLWVTDPYGEKCYYSNTDTHIGGHISKDFTQGYGPEEFLLKKAIAGKYIIQANYYGNRQQILAGATTIQCTLITNFGKPNEKRQAITLRLKDIKEVVDVGEFEFKQ